MATEEEWKRWFDVSEAIVEEEKKKGEEGMWERIGKRIDAKWVEMFPKGHPVYTNEGDPPKKDDRVEEDHEPLTHTNDKEVYQ